MRILFLTTTPPFHRQVDWIPTTAPAPAPALRRPSPHSKPSQEISASQGHPASPNVRRETEHLAIFHQRYPLDFADFPIPQHSPSGSFVHPSSPSTSVILVPSLAVVSLYPSPRTPAMEFVQEMVSRAGVWRNQSRFPTCHRILEKPGF